MHPCVAQDNFLRTSLASLSELAEGQTLAPALAAELGRFWRFVSSQFGVTEAQLRTAAMDEEDEPVVVGLSE